MFWIRSRECLIVDILWWATSLVLGMVLVVHFSLVLLHVLPNSPLTRRFDPVVSRYTNPFFTQTWNFFAPVPITYSSGVIVRGRYRVPGTTIEKETEWLDVSAPLVAEIRRNRLSPLELVQLGLSNAVLQYENFLSSNPNLSIPDP